LLATERSLSGSWPSRDGGSESNGHIRHLNGDAVVYGHGHHRYCRRGTGSGPELRVQLWGVRSCSGGYPAVSASSIDQATELGPWQLDLDRASCRRGIQGRQATQAEAPTAEGAQVRGAQHPPPAGAGRRGDDRARPCGLRGQPPTLTGARPGRQGPAVAPRAAPQGSQTHTLKPDPGRVEIRVDLPGAGRRATPA
jgi:hypothetical protein